MTREFPINERTIIIGRTANPICLIKVGYGLSKIGPIVTFVVVAAVVLYDVMLVMFGLIVEKFMVDGECFDLALTGLDLLYVDLPLILA